MEKKKLLSPLFFGLTSKIFFSITGGSRKSIVSNQENSFSWSHENAVLQFVVRKWQNVFTPFGYKVQIRLIMSMVQSGIDVTLYNQNKK